ncbi:MAG: hypothetical protein U0736_27965 [Gemmataceae bacterium]
MLRRSIDGHEQLSLHPLIFQPRLRRATATSASRNASSRSPTISPTRVRDTGPADR